MTMSFTSFLYLEFFQTALFLGVNAVVHGAKMNKVDNPFLNEMSLTDYEPDIEEAQRVQAEQAIREAIAKGELVEAAQLQE